jgi:hypothetical protein
MCDQTYYCSNLRGDISELDQMLEKLSRHDFMSGTTAFCVHSRYLWWFALVFLLRYTRVITSSLGNYMYRSTPLPIASKYHDSDIKIVLPTTNLRTHTLHKVVRSILKHSIAKLIISTAGPKIEE